MKVGFKAEIAGKQVGCCVGLCLTICWPLNELLQGFAVVLDKVSHLPGSAEPELSVPRTLLGCKSCARRAICFHLDHHRYDHIIQADSACGMSDMLNMLALAMQWEPLQRSNAEISG